MSQNRNILSQMKFPTPIFQYFQSRLKKAPLLLILHHGVFFVWPAVGNRSAINEGLTVLSHRHCLKLV